MQPNHDSPDWRQPAQQPTAAPYVAVPDELPKDTPVVTLSPDVQPASAAPTLSSTPVVEETMAASTPAAEPVHWQAAEYIHHDKGSLWFIVFSVVVAVFIAVAIFVIKSITFAVLVPVMAASLIVYSYRPPRINDYTLSRQGLHINDRLYSFAEFKSFGVIHDQGEYSIMLIPIKRFKPGVSVYFPEAAGEAIVDMLGVRLPMQKLQLDFVDQLIRKLRI